MRIAAISFRDKYEREIIIYPQGEWDNINFDKSTCEEMQDMIVYHSKDLQTNTEISKLEVLSSDIEGKSLLRLREAITYVCRMKESVLDDNNLINERLCFPNENNKFLNVTKDRDSFSFNFINYLGRTYLKDRTGYRFIEIEIIPQKINYEEDYIELTKKLAEECTEILLDHSGVTSNMFGSSDNENSKSLLEQFIFLREFCYTYNLQALFKYIKRNPDRMITKEEVLSPTCFGAPSSKFYSNPFSHSRGWKVVNGTPIPQEVTITRKFDSLDTLPNRFVKYALKKFKDICMRLCSSMELSKSENTSQKLYSECYREAAGLYNDIDEILRDSYFDEIGELKILPQGNQILQKREGYRQIFSAFFMLDLALQLNWEGEKKVYNGESKNTALLYEYWLFFELRKIIKSIDDCKFVQSNENPFITRENGLTLSLSEGETSCQSFIFQNMKLRVNLYYNRLFSRKEFSNTKYSGSYSRPFRPDYTLEIYPLEYSTPEKAVKEGVVSYIHFDAKYRVTNLKSLIGQYDDDLTEVQVKKEIEEDKRDSITNTYKRGDLLKMHTYNDAIRRTVGSYVLYPGESSSNNQNYRLFEEILPGVGAFAIKPSIQEISENALKDFITEIIETKSKNYSRLNRIIKYSNHILSEPAITMLDKRSFENKVDNKNIHNELNAIGYIRPDYYRILINRGLLSMGKTFIFYYYAIKGESVYSHHEDISKVKYFRFYQNEIYKTGTYRIEPIIGIIKSSELVSRKQLSEILTNANCNDGKERYADFYYVHKIEVVDEKKKAICCKINELNSVNGNDTFSPHSPKVVTEEWLNANCNSDSM